MPWFWIALLLGQWLAGRDPGEVAGLASLFPFQIEVLSRLLFPSSCFTLPWENTQLLKSHLRSLALLISLGGFRANAT